MTGFTLSSLLKEIFIHSNKPVHTIWILPTPSDFELLSKIAEFDAIHHLIISFICWNNPN